MVLFDFNDSHDKAENKEKLINFFLESKNIDSKKELFELFDDKLLWDDLINKITTFAQIWNIEIKKNIDWDDVYCSIEWLLDCWDGPIDIKKPIWSWKTIFDAISDFYSIIQKWGDFVVRDDSWYYNIWFQENANERVYFKTNRRFYGEYVYQKLSPTNQDQRNILLQSDVIKSRLLNYNWLSFGQNRDDNKFYVTGSYMYSDENGENEIIIYWDDFDEMFEEFLDIIKSEKWFYYLNHKTKYYIKYDQHNHKFIESKI